VKGGQAALISALKQPFLFPESFSSCKMRGVSFTWRLELTKVKVTSLWSSGRETKNEREESLLRGRALN
jgi:hypothetical protein